MKKIIATIIIIILISLSCYFMFFFMPKNDVAFAKGIKLKHGSITLYTGDTYNLQKGHIEVTPVNCTEKIIFSSSDTKIASVNPASGVVNANGIGQCVIDLKIKSSQTEFIETSINFNVIDKIIYPTTASIDKQDITLVVGQIETNILKLSENSNVIPTIIYQNQIVDYDYVSGKLVAKCIGTDTITILVPKSKTENFILHVFVTVKNKQVTEQNITLEKMYSDYKLIQYQTESSRKDVIISIISGENLIELPSEFLDYKSFVILLKQTGLVKILVDSPTDSTIFIIQII